MSQEFARHNLKPSPSVDTWLHDVFITMMDELVAEFTIFFHEPLNMFLENLHQNVSWIDRKARGRTFVESVVTAFSASYFYCGDLVFVNHSSSFLSFSRMGPK